jgi:hypothetical protein
MAGDSLVTTFFNVGLWIAALFFAHKQLQQSTEEEEEEEDREVQDLK